MNNEIYSQGLKALAKANYGAGEIDSTVEVVSLDNPFCGDRVNLLVGVADGCITSVTHSVKGCLLCQAAASAVGYAAKGMKLDDMLQVCDQMAMMISGEAPYEPPHGWEMLSVFEPVKANKSRHNCVLLPFQSAALAISKQVIDEA